MASSSSSSPPHFAAPHNPLRPGQAAVFPGDYSDLSAVAENILDFEVPSGVALSALKTISRYFDRHISVGLINSPKFVGFNFKSWQADSHLADLAKGLSRGAAVEIASPADTVRNEDVPLKGFKLSSYLFDDGSVEALVDHRWSERLRVQLSGISSMKKNMSHMNFFGYRQSGNWCTRYIYMTEEHMLGVSGLRTLASHPEWAVGGEVFYSFTQEAPGLSIGARYQKLSPITNRTTLITTTFSPIPGQIIATYSSDLTNSTIATTRFEYNVHSNEAEFGVGVRLSPPASPFSLRFRADTAHGLGIILEAKFTHFTLSTGAGCSFPPNVQTRIGLNFRLDNTTVHLL